MKLVSFQMHTRIQTSRNFSQGVFGGGRWTGGGTCEKVLSFLVIYLIYREGPIAAKGRNGTDKSVYLSEDHVYGNLVLKL